MKKLFALMFIVAMPVAPANAVVMNNQTIENGCNISNVGVYDGTATMTPTYTVNSYTCAAGTYLPADGVACAACPPNNYCYGGTYKYNATTAQGAAAPVMNNTSTTDACNHTYLNTYDGTATMVPQYTINSYTCAAGTYLPTDGIACAACPRGNTCAGGTYTYNPTDDQGATIASYTCAAGTYLPADGVACAACPTNNYCYGGTYKYNATTAQGAATPVMNNTSTTDACNHTYLNTYDGTATMVPQYTINSYTCAAGTYLPADGVACAACLPGAVCAGGTYTYNATDDQGMVCNGTIYLGACHAPCSVGVGIFHAGEYSYPVFADRTNVPSPVLHIRRDENTVCYVYMEQTDGNQHGLHVMYENTPYRAIDPR